MLIRGAHVYSPGYDLGQSSVRTEGGVIKEVSTALTPAPGEEVVEAEGFALLPGFVDIHSHGRGGADFCDATDAAFDTIGVGKLADGVTSFLATGLTRPESDLAELCRAAERYKARGVGATCLGVHLEGPFFNGKMAGAQNPAFLKNPDAQMVLRLNAISRVLKVSLAPELPGAMACIRALAAAGIVTSGGHSEADFATFEAAHEAGMRHLTHFCNTMLPIHHLKPSMVVGGLLEEDVLLEIITDGVHLSDPMIRLIAKVAGPDRLMVITDAMCAAGEPDGIYSLGGLRVKVEKGRATLADVPFDPQAVVSNVAGSVALYPQCVRRLARVTGWPMESLVKAAGYNQLRSLGIADRGEIRPGQIADLVLVGAGLDPVMTIVGGGVKWRDPGFSDRAMTDRSAIRRTFRVGRAGARPSH